MTVDQTTEFTVAGHNDANTKRPLLMFDFDYTTINVDTDEHLMEAFPASAAGINGALMSAIRKHGMEAIGGAQSTALFDQLIVSDGHSVETIRAALGKIVVPSAMIDILKLAKLTAQPSSNTAKTASGVKQHLPADVYIVSAANSFTISAVLKAHGIDHLVDGIITHPASVQPHESTERIVVQNYHDHSCTRTFYYGPDDDHRQRTCWPSMCKGNIVAKLYDPDRHSAVAFAGDGGNDFCAMCNLDPRAGRAYVRREFALEEHLQDDERNLSQIRAPVMYWSSHEDLRDLLTDDVFGRKDNIDDLGIPLTSAAIRPDVIHM
ncbi:hypothetical protein GQ42DRAFT_83419 [Ramicandelaber brevisporus]|nr:hypothetical protein GQ42DRAFT_83419 [Ramicandelaber brevisporus]